MLRVGHFLLMLGLLMGIAMPVRAQSGPGALVYCGSGGCILDATNLTDALKASGANPVTVATTLPELDAYRLLFVMNPVDGFSGDAATIKRFWSAGGTLVLVGECARWGEQANADINSLLTASGVPIQIVTDSLYPDFSCSSFVATVSSASPLMAGVTGLKFAWTSSLSAPSSLVLATYETINLVAGDVASRIIVAADANVFLDTCAFTADTNLRFFKNLWQLASSAGQMMGGQLDAGSQLDAGGGPRGNSDGSGPTAGPPAMQQGGCSAVGAGRDSPWMPFALVLLLVWLHRRSAAQRDLTQRLGEHAPSALE